MYAVLKTGGKQYRVAPGEEILVEQLTGDVGAKLDLSEVLLIDDGTQVSVGRPYVEGAKVHAEIVGHGRGEKLIVFKKIRRQGKQRKRGHRQAWTRLKVNDIAVG